LAIIPSDYDCSWDRTARDRFRARLQAAQQVVRSLSMNSRHRFKPVGPGWCWIWGVDLDGVRCLRAGEDEGIKLRKYPIFNRGVDGTRGELRGAGPAGPDDVARTGASKCKDDRHYLGDWRWRARRSGSRTSRRSPPKNAFGYLERGISCPPFRGSKKKPLFV